jgi:hypothetical protein
MELMKPAAENVGPPKYSVGDLVYWWYPLLREDNLNIRSPTIVLEVPREKDGYYLVLALKTGYHLVCKQEDMFDNAT